ncbi:excinuclease ABC subunit C [Candidatus Woesebacteria bacterium RBG_19FT_COMBO_42_9]|uniref:Excinuclease ABC subunit C n=1 Tax=Candidatus Woesebacteria bacterium RBG_16_42_24 TaxID=1802485 RepID=A0A1F7XM42_9BACT|nr:MAG: excinuclease ABC subunit C [Candidatus Woesebacteria bacterium RBG_16_42_24]OGM17003.1 MAG: excinuclease ABC subunit C [Candidatus Woesebacteria bacterium RBG_19FT_COMBO_42_9]OGM68464.1 MAG: excinuclease ABC subunit C [Candidatus Woesebacteria bacterium RIFCSPLOWO2_01_FULL_43_11]
MYYVYLLKLNNGNYYTGYSANLEKRIVEHKRGKILTTKNALPLKLVYYSVFFTRKRALAFEKYLKSSSGFAFRNKRLI